jgi:hypothetical protein
VIGRSRLISIDRVIYVVPSVYGQLADRNRYSIARLIGEITRLEIPQENSAIILIGPGRWGTTTPSLGVPVSFSEISGVSVVCEIAEMRDNLIPDVSLGTHFFGDLVEMDMLYLGVHPLDEGNFVNQEFFQKARNKLEDLLPATPEESLEAVKVVDAEDLPMGQVLRFYANTVEQEAACYVCEE